MKKDLSPREAAQRLGVALSYLYSLIWTGRLEAEKVNTRWRIPSAAVEQRLRQREARDESDRA